MTFFVFVCVHMRNLKYVRFLPAEAQKMKATEGGQGGRRDCIYIGGSITC